MTHNNAKHKLYAKEIVKGKSRREAYKAAYGKESTDGNISKIHNSMSVQNSIAEQFEAAGMPLKRVLKLHARNMSQEKNPGVSQSAVKDYYEITGLLGQKNKSHGQVAIIINEGEVSEDKVSRPDYREAPGDDDGSDGDHRKSLPGEVLERD